MIWWLIVPAMAALNAFRGGRFVADEDLPGRNLYYAAPFMVFLLWALAWPILEALAWGAAYFLWATWSWGHLIGMGYFEPTDRPAPFHERVCRYLGLGIPVLAMFWREMYISPGLALVAWVSGDWGIAFLATPYAATAAFMRWLAWKTARPAGAVMWGEILEGAIWGLLIALCRGIEWQSLFQPRFSWILSAV